MLNQLAWDMEEREDDIYNDLAALAELNWKSLKKKVQIEGENKHGSCHRDSQ